MPRLSTRSTVHERNASSEDDRVFADDEGRLWSVAHLGDATVFTCISDGRRSGRALAVENAPLDASVGDETLRAWLHAAPRIGTLP
jgi:hypothetical protein